MIYVLSGTNAYAFITVTYPAGSTLTCTSGSTTLMAKTTTGSYVFCVPRAGTWTVKATSGKNTASKSVSITSRWQSKSVILSYQFVLFDGGEVNGITWSSYDSPSGASSSVTDTITMNSNAYDSGISIVYPLAKRGTSAAVDFLNRTTLKAHISSIKAKSSTAILCVGTTALNDNVASLRFTPTAGGTFSVSVPSGTGSCYVSLQVSADTLGDEETVKVDKVWLE